MVLGTRRLEGGDLIAYDAQSRPIARLGVQMATIITHNSTEDETPRTTLTVHTQCPGQSCPFRAMIEGVGQFSAHFEYVVEGERWSGDGKIALMRGAVQCQSSCAAIFDGVEERSPATSAQPIGW